MRYIIELSSANVQAIKSLMDLGKYESIQSFVLAAIENQLYIEKQPIESSMHADFAIEESREEITSLNNSLISRPALESSEVKVVEEPQPELLSAETLWALYNRIFPIKITLRVLLNIMKSNRTEDGYVSLVVVQDAATEEARKLGRELSHIDTKSRRVHGDKLSTGLPRKGNRSGDRFKSNFVGTINSKGHVEGALAILRFVNIRKDEAGKPQIGITESGFRFAIMENPILDKSEYSRVFYDEEIDFYLKHISEKLRKEYLLSINLLRAVKSGNCTPNELVKVILEASPDLSRKEAEAIRSSAVSRLSELGMLTRRREGLNVTYTLSTRALNLLRNQTTHER